MSHFSGNSPRGQRHHANGSFSSLEDTANFDIVATATSVLDDGGWCKDEYCRRYAPPKRRVPVAAATGEESPDSTAMGPSNGAAGVAASVTRVAPPLPFSAAVGASSSAVGAGLGLQTPYRAPLVDSPWSMSPASQPTVPPPAPLGAPFAPSTGAFQFATTNLGGATLTPVGPLVSEHTAPRAAAIGVYGYMPPSPTRDAAGNPLGGAGGALDPLNPYGSPLALSATALRALNNVLSASQSSAFDVAEDANEDATAADQHHSFGHYVNAEAHHHMQQQQRQLPNFSYESATVAGADFWGTTTSNGLMQPHHSVPLPLGAAPLPESRQPQLHHQQQVVYSVQPQSPYPAMTPGSTGGVGPIGPVTLMGGGTGLASWFPGAVGAVAMAAAQAAAAQSAAAAAVAAAPFIGPFGYGLPLSVTPPTTALVPPMPMSMSALPLGPTSAAAVAPTVSIRIGGPRVAPPGPIGGTNALGSLRPTGELSQSAKNAQRRRALKQKKEEMKQQLQLQQLAIQQHHHDDHSPTAMTDDGKAASQSPSYQRQQQQQQQQQQHPYSHHSDGSLLLLRDSCQSPSPTCDDADAAAAAGGDGTHRSSDSSQRSEAVAVITATGTTTTSGAAVTVASPAKASASLPIIATSTLLPHAGTNVAPRGSKRQQQLRQQHEKSAAAALVAAVALPGGSWPLPAAPHAYHLTNVPIPTGQELPAEASGEGRYKQLCHGYTSAEYAKYRAAVPRHERQLGNPNHPLTPRADCASTRRAFRDLVFRWRQDLHRWDAMPDAAAAHAQGLPTLLEAGLEPAVRPDSPSLPDLVRSAHLVLGHSEDELRLLGLEH